MKMKIKPIVSIVQKEFAGHFWRRKEITERTGLSYSQIKKLVNTDPDFPRPIQLSKKITMWHALEIISYIESLQMSKKGKKL